MRSPSALVWLTDIVEAIDLIQREMAGTSLAAFARDKRKRWLVERGIEIISEASRRLPDALKARRAEIPWPKVAAIGNILRHAYQHVAYDVLWHVVREELPQLDQCAGANWPSFPPKTKGWQTAQRRAAPLCIRARLR